MSAQLFNRSSAIIAIMAMLAVSILPLFAYAEAPHNISTAPGVIDQKMKQRDILNESVTIQNTSNRPLSLFPAVEDVNPDNGDQSFGYAVDSRALKDSLAIG